jgi:WD40 repeat protein
MLELKAISAKERAMRGLLYGFAAVLLVLGWVLPTQAEERPLLQLDTGGHMAEINNIAFTPDGTRLVSASDDKVIRVWDLATGKTVRAIRGEIAPGDAGKIYAMALSPDGKWLAAGGWMHPECPEKCGEIGLFDFASGELKALLKGHNKVVKALAFSPDGRRLISGSRDRTAILWEVSLVTAPGAAAKTVPAILNPMHRLKGHTDTIYAAGFTPDGARAVTGAWDNELRLWRVADGQEIAVMKGHAGRVQSLAVARDGTIASGDWSGEVRLWNGRTGVFLRTLARQGTTVGSLSFSPDGKTLLSSCVQRCGANYRQYVYDVATSRELVTYREHDNIVIATAISPDGHWAATGGGGNNEIHIWDVKTGKRRAGPDGTPLTLGGTGRPAFAAGFSANGKAIGWGNSWRGGGTINDLGPLQFTLTLPLGLDNLGAPQPLDETAAKSFRGAVTELDGWSLSHRKGGAYEFDAILDITQDQHVVATIERDSADGYRHHSYSFTPDGQTIISGGGNGMLIAYDRAGKTFGHFVGHEGDVYAVAVSPEGTYLVSGSADQTVRLWDVKTRALLVTLFRGSDGEWVIWTPEGFFVGSEKGAERVGWHINQGPDKEARYVTGAQLKKFFFRPDLVAEKIKGDPEGKVRDAAAKIDVEALLKIALAPAVEVLSPAPGAFLAEAKVTVTARIRNTGGGIGAMRFKVNGQVVGSAYGAIALDPEGRMTREFELATAVSTIEVVAATPAGVESLAASATVKTDARAIRKDPRLFVLAVGADSYRDIKKKLNYARSDAETLAKAFGLAGTGFYRGEPVVRTLFDEDVTAGKVEAAFDNMAGMVRATDVFVFYMAGHGKTLNGDFHFVPPAISSFTDDAIRKESFGPDKLSAWFAKISALKSIWVVDACESGSAGKLLMRDAASDDAALQRLRSDTGRTIFMAAGEEQAALEGYRKHGLLTYALIEGIARAGSGDHVRLYDFADYVRTEVPKLSRELEGCKVTGPEDYCQKPVIGLGSAENYPVLPRSAKVLALIDADGPIISKKPTHAVMVSAQLFEAANRGGVGKRQLERGEQVTLIKAESGWAYIAKGGKPLGYVEQEKLLQLKE